LDMLRGSLFVAMYVLCSRCLDWSTSL
jgi:hypothetical protein